jgi:lysophospholipase
MSNVSQPPTLQQLQDLRACLPDLAFDPDKDQPISQTLLAAHYLRYFGIDFEGKYFHRWGRVMLPTYTIASHYWLPALATDLPEKGMVVIVHGYFDHVGLYGHLIRYLLESGYGVVAFDLPGHGLSSGERASIESFTHYVEVFKALLAEIQGKFNVPVSAIGQSTGGAILLKYLANGGDGVGKVTLLAPLVEPAYWWFNRAIYALSGHRLKGMKRKFLANSSDGNFVNFLAHGDPLQARYIPIAWIGAMKSWVDECRAMVPCDHPVTVLQGTADTTLAWRFNLKLLTKKFPQGRFVQIEGARHHLVNERDELREQVFEQMGF